MDKAKLPKEVAEAIEGVRKHAHADLLFDFSYIKDVCENEKYDAPKLLPIYNYIGDNGFLNYFTALVNGYEVEQTPEERVKELYLKRKELGYTERAIGIYEALHALGIKIVGVNAE